MSIPPNSRGRECAAYFPQPMDEAEKLACEDLKNCVYYFNCRVANPPLLDIEYRSSNREYDILHSVFCWDNTPYEEVFQNGIRASPQQHNFNSDEVYFNLLDFVHHRGSRLLEYSNRPISTHPFISTTLNNSWHPSLDTDESMVEVYRYEIYAPGGIWGVGILGDLCRYPGPDKVYFVGGIAPQYIRSAQRFTLTLAAGTRRTRWERVDTKLILNRNFNPQSDPPRLLDIRNPISHYLISEDDETAEKAATLDKFWWYPPETEYSRREKQSVVINSDWYADKVANSESYIINAAFRSSRTNEAYIFMKNEYVLIDYAPGSTMDRVIHGPLLIRRGYPSLMGTALAEYGIDCAFGSHNTNEAFIFSGNLCARINFAPRTLNDKIIEGPMAIKRMFPFLKGTVFESGIDAAFESTKEFEAYLFKDNQYARINYASSSDSGRLINTVRLTTDGFVSLKNTIFESGIDAAFASHRTDEAYLFKGDSYARINFAPGTTNDYIMGGVKKIQPNWPALYGILPRKNHGIDVHANILEYANKIELSKDEEKLIVEASTRSSRVLLAARSSRKPTVDDLQVGMTMNETIRRSSGADLPSFYRLDFKVVFISLFIWFVILLCLYKDKVILHLMLTLLILALMLMVYMNNFKKSV